MEKNTSEVIIKTAPDRKSTHVQQILRFGIFLVFALIIYRMIDVDQLGEILRRVRLDIIVLALFLYFGNIAIRAYRWQRIFNKDGLRVSFKDAYILTLIGVALNIVVPATLGDIVRSYYGYKIHGIREEMLSTMISDKVFALCSLFLLGGVSGYFMGYYGLGTISIVMAVLTSIPLFFPTLVPWKWLNIILKIFKKSLDRDKLVRSFTLPAALKVEAMGLSIGVWLCTCVFFYLLCTAFLIDVRLGYVILIMPILTIVRLFPFTVNSLGPPEIALAYLFHSIGIPSTVAVFISLLSNVLASIIPGTFGLVLMVVHRPKKPYQPILENNGADTGGI